MTDLHVHTEYSFDSDELPENYIAAASSRGDRFIGFADHCEYNMSEYDADFPIPNFGERCAAFKALSEKYPDVKILNGVEMGYSDSAADRYKMMLAKYPFDYGILSIHTVGKRGDCCFPSFYCGLDKRDAYELYLSETLKAVRSDIDFQILGHIGYISRYAPYSDKTLAYGEFGNSLDKILRAIIARSAAIELNTSAAGLPSQIVTDKSIITRYVELGGNSFTFGSDAHSVERYAQNVESVKELLFSLGVNRVFRYENRKPVIEYF